MELNKQLGPYALQLYLYLAKNADNYNLALSQQAAENEAGIKRTTFHKYVSLLIEEGYLVQKGGNTYDFYETPQFREMEEAEPPQDENACAWDEQENPPDDLCSSRKSTECSRFNREIDKT